MQSPTACFPSMQLLFLRFLLAFCSWLSFSFYHSTVFHWVGVSWCTYLFCCWAFRLVSGFFLLQAVLLGTFLSICISPGNRLKSRVASIWNCILLNAQAPSIPKSRCCGPLPYVIAVIRCVWKDALSTLCVWSWRWLLRENPTHSSLNTSKAALVV